MRCTFAHGKRLLQLVLGSDDDLAISVTNDVRRRIRACKSGARSILLNYFIKTNNRPHVSPEHRNTG